jgi:hypothetical protein
MNGRSEHGASEPVAPGEATAIAIADQFAPASLDDGLRRYLAIVAPLFSIGILVAIVWRLQRVDLGGIWADLPSSPVFWCVFVLYYMTLPVSDWIIFRHLWRIPASGLGALMRKRLSNELLLGYSGELYFYAWARQRGGLSGAPFGAIKDVAILSALAGNVVTLILFFFAFPVLGRVDPGINPQLLLFGALAVMAPPLLAMVVRGHLFGLPAAQTRFVLSIHFARLITTGALTVLLWHLVLPQFGIAWWLALVSLQLLVSRLPFVPNKDVVFAGACLLLLGRHVRIVELTAMMASLVLVGHLVVGTGLGLTALLRPDPGRRA